MRQPWGDGWALVGDAGYMSDPITAHGITNALRDADILARTIVEGESLASYQTARDDLSFRFFEVSDRVASLDWDIPTVQQYHRIMSQEMAREEASMVAAHPASLPRRILHTGSTRRPPSACLRVLGSWSTRPPWRVPS